MNDTCRHQMAQVIGLEVQARGEGLLMVVANFDADIRVVSSMGVNARITFGNDDRCMDIAVVALAQSHLLNELVHQHIELGVFGHSIDGCTGFQPFVHVAVVERRTVVLTLHGTRCYLEIAETVAAVGTFLVECLPGCSPGIPHIPDGGVAKHTETVAPETARPLHTAQWQILHLGLPTVTHVRQTALCHCRCGTAYHCYSQYLSHSSPPLAFTRSYQASRSFVRS